MNNVKSTQTDFYAGYKTARVIHDMGGGHGGGTTNPPTTPTQPPTTPPTK